MKAKLVFQIGQTPPLADVSLKIAPRPDDRLQVTRADGPPIELVVLRVGHIVGVGNPDGQEHSLEVEVRHWEESDNLPRRCEEKGCGNQAHKQFHHGANSLWLCRDHYRGLVYYTAQSASKGRRG